MAKYPNITLTNAGLSMIAKSQGSGQLIFTSIKLGDGAISTGEDIKVLTDLKNVMLTANISSIDDSTSGQVALTSVISNSNVLTGFWAKELGIYAKVGTDGTEQLYAYTNAGNYADYMPDKNTPIDENQIKVTLVVGNASGVTAIIDSSIVYATLEKVNTAIADHNKSTSAHAELMTAHNAATDAHADIREEIKKVGLSIGTVIPYLVKSAPAGWLALDTGALVSRTTYAELWAWVQANAPLISETDWQTQAASQSSVGAYSTGDGSTTFRLPKILDYIRGGLTADVGKWQGDAIRNITGLVGGRWASDVSNTGAFTATADSSTYYNNTAVGTGYGATLDASKVVPTADENRPKTIKMLYCVKAFDAETNQGLIDITALANEMAAKVNKTDYVADFAKSFAVNGYQKLPNGLIMQWGGTTTLSGDVATTVTLPIAYPNACFIVSASAGNYQSGLSGIDRVTGVSAFNWTKTNFQVASQLQTPRSLAWISIGC